MCSNLPWRSSPSPVIRVVKLHHEMSNVCLMGVGEASIKLIVDHWVNFSYLENPSFPKCCECGGYDGRLWAKTKRRLASNTALCSRTTFMGFTDSEDGDDEVLVLMIVLASICDFFYFHTRSAICSFLHFKLWSSLLWGFTVESDVSGWLSPIRCSVLYLFLCQQRSVDKDATFLSSWNIWRLHSSVLRVISSYWCWCRARTAGPWSCSWKSGNDILICCALSEYALCMLCILSACALMHMQTFLHLVQ